MRVSPTAMVIMAVTVAALFLAGHPDLKPILWGLHSWTWLTPATLIGVVLVSLLAALLILRPPPFPDRILPAAAIALLASPAFYGLRDTTHLLGDGRYWISILGENRPYHPFQPLAFGSAWLLTSDVRSAAPAARALRVEIAAVVLGVIAVFLLIRLARHIAEPHERGRWFVLLCLVATGTLQFGFGYIEAYPVLWVAVLAYFLVTFQARNTRGFVGSAFCLGIAAAAHGTALLLAPGLLARLRSLRVRPATWILCGLSMALPLVVAYVLLPRVLPSIAPDDAEAAGPAGVAASMIGAFFSAPGHLADAVTARLNGAFLLAPAGVLLLVLSLVENHPRVIWNAFRNDPDLAFLGISALGMGAPLLLLNTGAWRGAAMDWDTFAVAAVPVSALGVRLLFQGARASADARIGPALLVAAGVFLTSAFVAVNSDPQAAMSRFETLIHAPGATPRSRSWAFEALATVRRDRGELNEAAALYDSALAGQPGNARLLRTRAGVLSWAGRHRESADVYVRAAGLEPRDPGVWFNLGLELERCASPDSAALAYRQALRRRPGDVEIMNRLANRLLATGRRDEALELIRESLRRSPGQGLAREMREILARQGTPDGRDPK